jgi:hypothetical protein
MGNIFYDFQKIKLKYKDLRIIIESHTKIMLSIF